MSNITTAEALAHVVAGLDAAEERPGQLAMALAVERSLSAGEHLIVQAGTGTGKTIAYLTAAAVSGKRSVVVTATKALQDQLATKDLPFLQRRLSELGIDVTTAVLKGRSNYVCRQRLAEVQRSATGGQTSLEVETSSPAVADEVNKIAAWADETENGDIAELDWVPTDAAWHTVSVGSDECPGAARCPHGTDCFSERARSEAQAADVIVVNTHLYGLNVGAGGALLPEHDVVIFDEAHVIEDIMSDTVGVQIAPGRFATVATAVRRILDDEHIVTELANLATSLRTVLTAHVGRRLSVPIEDDIADELQHALERVVHAQEVITNIDDRRNEDVQQRKLRALRLLERTQQSLETALGIGADSVPFVSGPPDTPRLEIAPLDVAPALTNGVWAHHTAVLTSATIPTSLRSRVGLPAEETTETDVGSPFDYERQGLLYCAMHLPEPRSPKFRDAAADEIVTLIEASGGRTLALFTSWAGMDHAVEHARAHLDVEILTQRDLPKPALIKRFAADPATCLFATSGLFQGVDVPGHTLSQVIIDKLPFPRPDDPLLSARRELLGSAAFREIDVPRAATMLAQAVGRLIRTADDRGVVAVLDRRLGTARYRWDFVDALPPMRRTRHLSDVVAFWDD